MLKTGLGWSVDGTPVSPKRLVFARSAGALEWMDSQVRAYKESGALVSGQIRSFSAVFVVPKTSNSFRMVVDSRPVNRCLVPQPPQFKYAGLPQVVRLLEPGFWMVTIDMKQGYHQLRVSDSLAPYLGIRWRGEDLRFEVLPFGLSVAPYLFTRVMAAAVAIMRRRGLIVSAYLDDLIFAAPSREEMLRLRDTVLAPTLEELGIVRSPDKGSWEPSQQVRYLGLVLDTAAFCYAIPEDRRAALASMLGRLRRFAPGELIQARFLARIAGKLVFLCQAVSALRQAVWSLYGALQPLFSDPRGWSARVPMTSAALEDAGWLLRNLRSLAGDPLRRPEQLLVVTADASDSGWGCTISTVPMDKAGGGWRRDQRSLHIQEREMLAILFGLHRFRGHLTGRRLVIRSDNTAVVAYLRKGGGMRSPALRDLTRKVLACVLRARASIVAVEWLSTTDNSLADHLSRHPWEVASDWRVSPSVFSRLSRHAGARDFDLFASPRSAQVAHFAAAAPFPTATVRDAFVADWSILRAWAAPPLGLVPRVVSHVLELSRAGRPLDLVLVLPYWPSSWWWAPLAGIAQRVIPLGLAGDVVVATVETELAQLPDLRLSALIVRSH